MKRKLMIGFFVMLSSVLSAQDVTVTGTVTSREGGYTIPGVSVLVKGTSIGTTTGADGIFTLNTQMGQTLRFSFIGMNTKEVNINAAVINVQMDYSVSALDEVVVVGYGVMRRSDVTGAVASVDEKTLENRPSPNLINSLQGAVAGLSISMLGSNAEGSATQTRIRGSRSITASNVPLVILDGIPYNGNWAEISPGDIESIEVLKDASSTAVYGARGANGVILIQTKRGKRGERPVMRYESSFTMLSPINIPQMMDGETYYRRKQEAGQVFSYTENEMYELGESTDWVDLALRNGMNHSHTISLRGAGEASRYFVSGNFANNQGIARNDDFSRITLRINFQQDIGEYVSIGTNTQYGYYDRSGNEANFSDAFLMNPLGRPYTESGDLRLQTWEDNNYARNPLSPLNELNNNYKNMLFTNNFVDVTFPIEGLSFKLNTGYTYENFTVQNYRGRNTYEGAMSNGIMNINNRYDIDWIVDNIVSYNRIFGPHALYFTGLYSAQSARNERSSIEASDFHSDLLTFYQPDKGSVLMASAAQTKSAHLSQMGRLNYSYDSRYLFTTTVRRDGYSAFGDDTKYGIFPSVAVGWNLMNEDFFQRSTLGETINNFKIRLSWGKSGNEAISPYASLPVLVGYDYLTDSHSPAFGFFPSRLASPMLGWETTASFNLGIDFGLLQDRIHGSIELYESNTYDLLLSRTIPSINGTSTILENIGQTAGRGVELQLSSVNMHRGKFQWSTDLSLMRDRSRLVDVGLYDENGNPMDDIASLWFIGEPVNVNYDYLFDGIYQVGEVPPDAPFNSQPGYIRYKDLNGDGNITPEHDQKIIGSRTPALMGGLNNVISYGNFSMSIFIHGQVGVTRPNFLMAVHTISFRRNQLDKEFWSEDNPINTYPANVADGSVNPARMNFYQRTDFLRIQDISLSYRMPESVIDQLRMQRLEIYANVRNLYTFTNWVGLDPEFVTSGTRQRAIPQTMQFTVGIRTAF